jgi:hypothetical protein
MADDSQTDARDKKGDAKVLAEARKRHERGSKAASRNVDRYREAMSFVAGAQWDDRLKRVREAAQRPVLVMDRLGTHINQVVNDQRQSKPSIKVHPVDDKGDVKVAEVYDGMIRSIERQSNAQMVYETASWTQVAAGQGAMRVLSKYVDENAFEQDLFIERILDPTCVIFDPDAKEQDASDGKWCFVVEMMSREAFEEKYPDATPADWGAQNDPAGWWSVDQVRCVEYYRIVEKPTTLHLMPDGSVLDDEALKKAQPPVPPVASRPGKRAEVDCYKLGGSEVLSHTTWLGRYIPVVRVVGNEMVVDGEIVYTGLTHRAMDAQRHYNYQVSTVVEILSLQKSAPFIGAKGQFAGVEDRWKGANVANPPYLEYEPMDLNGTLLPPPHREPAPQVPTGNVNAMTLAAQDLQWITGQHAANFGAQSNETSGKAINARQREGDTATYHYLDNLSRSIMHVGRILVDAIPRYYDTRRVVRVLGEDDEASTAIHDPALPEAMVEQRTPNGIERIYNLGVGRYDLSVSVGPSFGTKRAEAVEAMTQLLGVNPQMSIAIMDLFVKSQDWPGAQQMAERLRKMVPPQLLGDEETGNDPAAAVGQLQATLQQMAQQLEMRSQQLQQAEQVMQQAGQEIETLRQQAAENRTQTMDKTQAAQVKAYETEVRAQADVRIAELNAEAEIAKSAQAQAQQEIGQLQSNIQAIQQQLAQIAAAALAPDEDEKPTTKVVQFQRGPDGKIVGAIVAEQEAPAQS